MVKGVGNLKWVSQARRVAPFAVNLQSQVSQFNGGGKHMEVGSDEKRRGTLNTSRGRDFP